MVNAILGRVTIFLIGIGSSIPAHINRQLKTGFSYLGFIYFMKSENSSEKLEFPGFHLFSADYQETGFPQDRGPKVPRLAQ